MRLFNTLNGKVEDFVPVEQGKAKIYFCGMTLQESPHIGHMRAFVTADVLHRHLLYLGYEVTLIINFTDIDDKVIRKSHEEGIDYRMITSRFEEEFRKASKWLNILPATFYPRATQHIQEIIQLIEKLIERGYAYEVDGDVYFSVRKFKGYGKLSGKNIDDLVSGARIEVDEKKRDPLDFALWKRAKSGEPYWHSPWGKGRPGWHIECSSMSMHYLGETFDIHGGGNDLIFPHHDNEIAQSECATGKPFARYWLHNGMITIKGDKMSKSLKNFVPVLDLTDEFHPNELRLYLLSSHYRSPLEYSDELLQQAKSGWKRIKNFLETALETDGEVSEETRQAYQEAMDNDLNTPEALGRVFELVRMGNSTEDSGVKGAVKKDIEFILGNLGFKPIEKEEIDFAPFVDLIVDVRNALRKEKLFPQADKIRDGLKSLGIIIEDTKEGTRWRKG